MYLFYFVGESNMHATVMIWVALIDKCFRLAVIVQYVFQTLYILNFYMPITRKSGELYRLEISYVRNIQSILWIRLNACKGV